VVTAIIFFSVFADIGWWAGFQKHQETYGEMLRLTYYTEDGLNNSLYLVGLILVLFIYPIVNQTVAQRIVSAYSESDARKGSMVSILPWFFVTGVAIIAGVVGTVLQPGLEDNRNDLFPLYMVEYLSPGMLGLGVAALVVGSMSTGAGIATAIAGLLTNDVFPIINNDKMSDSRKLWITRAIATGAIILGAFLSTQVGNYGGMVPFYVAFTGTFVLPLTIPYLATVFCPWASKGSALASLIAGCALGLVLFNAEDHLPIYMTQAQCRPLWVLGTTILMLVAWSLLENRSKGREPHSSLAARLNTFDFGKEMTPEEVKSMMTAEGFPSWRSKANVDYNKLGISATTPIYARPGIYEMMTVLAMVILMIWLW
jgi:Na+/proline symporter